MGAHHDHDHDHGFDGRSPEFRRALIVVIALNAAMFAVEMAAGAWADSKSLQADALDFAADTATYALSLAAIGWTLAWRARAALLKGASLAVTAAFVLITTLYAAFGRAEPDEHVMGVVGFMALAANVASALILLRFKDGDSNVRSVWLCTRNDAIGNVAVLAAALAVHLTGSAWPDLIVAFGMAGLFLASSIRITRQARGELRHATAAG